MSRVPVPFPYAHLTSPFEHPRLTGWEEDQAGNLWRYWIEGPPAAHWDRFFFRWNVLLPTGTNLGGVSAGAEGGTWAADEAFRAHFALYAPAVPNSGWIFSSGSRVDGPTWRFQGPAIPVRHQALVRDGRYHLAMSRDGGETWTVLGTLSAPPGTPDGPVSLQESP